MEISRKTPVNLHAKDVWLFEKELKKEIAAPVVVRRKNVLINANIEFTENLKHNTLLSRQANFFRFSAVSFFGKVIRNRFSIILKEQAVITDGWSYGYFHWLMDCLPRLILLRNSGIHTPLVLPPALARLNYVKESLKMLQEHNHRFLKKSNWYLLRKLRFPAHLAHTGNYDEGVMVQLRQAFTKDFQGNAGLKVYISRSKSARRKVDNEGEIKGVLQQAGFTEVFCEDLSFREQVQLFMNVKYVVANHGAGLSNMLFMAAGASVLELRREDDDHNNCYFSLASALNISYYYQCCAIVDVSHDIHNANIVVDAELLQTNLQLMSGHD